MCTSATMSESGFPLYVDIVIYRHNGFWGFIDSVAESDFPLGVFLFFII